MNADTLLLVICGLLTAAMFVLWVDIVRPLERAIEDIRMDIETLDREVDVLASHAAKTAIPSDKYSDALDKAFDEVYRR